MIPGMCAVGGTFVFVPVTGSQLWLDASDSATITIAGGGGVSQWADKSGNGRHVQQATGALQPAYSTAVQNGRNACLFDGTTQYMANAAAAMLRSVAGWTIFIVERPTQNALTAVSASVAASAGVSARASLQTAVTTGFDVGGGRRNNADAFGSTSNATQVSTAAWRLKTVVGDYTNTTITQRLSKSQVSQNTSWLTSGNTPNDEGGLVIANSPALSAFFKGYLGEILVYGSVLGSTDIATNENGLSTKWGL